MPGLVHDGALGGSALGRRGRKSGAERVSGEPLRIQAGFEHQSLDHFGELVIAEGFRCRLVSPAADRRKKMSPGNARLIEPYLQRPDGAGFVVRAIRDSDGLPGPFLVGFRFRDRDDYASAPNLRSSCCSATSSERRSAPANPTRSSALSRTARRSRPIPANMRRSRSGDKGSLPVCAVPSPGGHRP